MSHALAIPTPGTDLARPLSANEIVAQVQLIQQVMKAVMKDGTHFGTIPGTDKPSLYKAGAEKILSTFRIAIEPVVTDLSTADEVRFRVEARATHMGTGAYLGSGVGECSSAEEKYAWRAVACDEEWDATPEDRRRVKYRKGRGDDVVALRQVRTVPADVANTVLKMAKKRALVDGTLTITAASDVFAQDLEDLPEGLEPGAAIDGDTRRTPAPPARKGTTATTSGNTITGRVQAIESKTGKKKNGDAWTKWAVKVGDKWHGTFDAAVKDAAAEARDAGLEVRIAFKPTDYGRDIESLTIVEAPPTTTAPATTEGTRAPATREPGEDDQ